jgi:predicted naringenin-chalcone synthase
VGTAVPERAYTQRELFKLFGFKNRLANRGFSSPHIHRRHLFLPEPDAETGRLVEEPQPVLNEKMRRGSLDIGSRAIRTALERSEIPLSEVQGIFCVTSTGWMVPGLSAVLIRELGLDLRCQRLDIVGMGCNGGLNGLFAVDAWARANPMKIGVLLCCEINSAIYCLDDTAEDAIVNSLFGDGAAAVVVQAGGERRGPEILDSESLILPEYHDAMRFVWHEERSRWRFSLNRRIPKVLGAEVHHPVDALLKRHDLNRGQIDHWILHTGGGSVIDRMKEGLGLTEHDVRIAREVLRMYGNLSSGSFLFSYEQLVQEAPLNPGERMVMITLGPGAQIETALLRW